MSVASVAQLLQDQGGGGGGGSVFDTITIGPNVGTEVILSCTTADELLVAGETVATRPYVSSNYIDNLDYYTTTEFETYLTTNYTDTTDLQAGYVSNTTLTTDYSTTSEFETYLGANYTDNTALQAGYIPNTTLTTDYSTTSEFETYLTTNYTTTTALNAGYVANATLDSYYTKTEADNAYQPIGNYILSSKFGRFNGLVDITALAVGAVCTVAVTITGFVGLDTTAYLCCISSNFATPFTISAIFNVNDGVNTGIEVSFTNVSNADITVPSTVSLSVIAMN
jgi:hypothetical protein